MNIIIIEDEKLTSNDLATTISQLQPDACILAQLFSVKEGVMFFAQRPEVDLIFSDIQLGDGTSFDIFSQVQINAPIIFCTAYDEYALDAFKANGIDYILKPFTDNMVQAALTKYQALRKKLGGKPQPLEELFRTFMAPKSEGQGAVLVYHKDKILPIAMQTVAFFFLKNGVVHLTTFDKRTYYLNKNLDELEKTAGSLFFRVNRQYLVNRKAIIDASNYLSRKLSVSLVIPADDTVVVSKEKMPQFLNWLTQA